MRPTVRLRCDDAAIARLRCDGVQRCKLSNAAIVCARCGTAGGAISLRVVNLVAGATSFAARRSADAALRRSKQMCTKIGASGRKTLTHFFFLAASAAKTSKGCPRARPGAGQLRLTQPRTPAKASGPAALAKAEGQGSPHRYDAGATHRWRRQKQTTRPRPRRSTKMS